MGKEKRQMEMGEVRIEISLASFSNFYGKISKNHLLLTNCLHYRNSM